MRLIILYIVFILLTGCQTSRFIGSQTSKKARSIVNSWNCRESNGLIYSVELNTLSETDNLYSVNNFHFLGNDINAILKINGDKIDIPEQNLALANMTVKGDGFINKKQNMISINYYFSDGADLDTITAVYSLDKRNNS